MSDQLHHNDVQSLWQSQPPGGAAISLDQIHTAARRLEQRTTRRNRREYIAAVIAVAGWGPAIWFGPTTIVRLAAVLIITGVVFIVRQIHVHGTTTIQPADLALRSALEFHRAQLVRQRNLLQSVWLWALMPLVPGMVTFLIGLALANPARTPRIVAGGIAATAFMVGLHLLNRRAAARIQWWLDRLGNGSA